MARFGEVTSPATGTTGGFGSGFGGGFGNGFGSGFGKFGQTNDISSAEGLLELAMSQGGAISEAAQELLHPERSILSTIGHGFKNAFKGFVEVISVPNQIIAGMISKDVTIDEAIKKNISTSDVIFGEKDPNATTMQKIGSFLVRTATDILLDPLTFVTFGAGAGVAGLRALPKVTLGAKAATQIGKQASAAVALSDEGFDVYKYLRNAEKQEKGLTSALNLAEKTEAHSLARQELKALLDETIDAPLNMDLAKKSMSNLLEKYPQLTETLLDKGGMKVLGKTILSGQRIGSALKMIPGMTVLDNITKPARTAVNALFDPAMVKTDQGWVRLPEEFVNLEQSAKDLAESLGDARLNKLSDIVRANGLDINESKMLFAAVEARKMPADSRLANAYKQLLGFDEEEFKFLRESGIPVTFLDNHAPHVLVKTEVGSIPFMMPPKTTAEGAMQRKITGTLEEIKASGFEGFDENLVTAHAKRSLDNVNAGVARRFIRSVASSFGALETEAPAGWVKISNKGIREQASFNLGFVIGKEGEDLLFHPAVAKRIENFIGSVINDDATNDLLKKFDSLQNLWKASVTAIFPAFHGRNALSNVFMHFMDLGVHSLNPVHHTVAGGLIQKDRAAARLQRKALGVGPEAAKAQDDLFDLMNQKMFTDATGHEWTFGELRAVIKNNNVAFNRSIAGASDIGQSNKELVNALFPQSASKLKQMGKKYLPVGQEFVPFKFGREVGRAIEEQARLVDFIANLKNTGDVTLASQRTKQFLFDYNNLTNFERTFLRRMIPFYTFTRKNLELQARAFLTTPGRVAAEVKVLSGLGDLFAGAELTPEEREALPEWVKYGISILSKKSGPNVEIISSLGTPTEAAFNSIQGNQILGSVSPLLRVPVELTSGYNFFQRKPISEVTNAMAFKHAPEAVKDFIGYTEVTGRRKDGTTYKQYVALRPARMHFFLNLPPTSRVLSAMKQMEAENVSGQMKLMQQLIGVRPYSFDLEVEAQKRENEMKRKLEDLLTKAGVTAQFKRTFIPKD